MSRFERLSVLDASLLAVEDDAAHMHMGSVTIFDAGPLWKEAGGLEIERIRDYVLSRLHHIPRYRQRIAYTPVEGHPIWVDDESFNLNYHVRHTSLPLGAGERELKRLAGRILSQSLDRGKPLWEMWFVEGVGAGRFALITKIHHCMVDGVAGVELTSQLMSERPQDEIGPIRPWIAQPRPSRRSLLIGSTLHRPLTFLRDTGSALTHPQRTLGRVRETANGLNQIARVNAQPASETLLNQRIGPHRRIDWTQTSLADVKKIKQRLGGTVNDVVLAIVAGAIGKFLASRGTSLEDLDFRVAVPVNTRMKDQPVESTGNHSSMMPTPLPIAERDPAERLRQVIETTRERKASKIALVPDALERFCEWTSASLFFAFARLGSSMRTFNMVVTNVPGPQSPLYLLGARQAQVYPAVPLFQNQALGIAIFSYDGVLYWGFNADWERLPDLHDFAEAIDEEVEALRKAAGAASAEVSPVVGARRSQSAG
ncbi:MAG: wax ester/triacylglycerol synthase family O-acyltransferase [Deltaproteobacteria bacterium]|jgi:WS/DGAT/MGAT family acyltransferase|nr:wax ester/triacylglycerol synthase family O-acyltransferase [Deltaproteobacteria bacterium]MBW2499916.1 wax ester/triacylglycerol synthase family O-acyltransferase [Deltaproteobacteria bacterium]